MVETLPAKPAKSLRIVLKSLRVTLGEPIDLRVSYTNQGTQMLTFREPAKEWAVMLVAIDPIGSTRRVSFGKLFYSEYGGRSRTVVERAKEVQLAPGGRHTFHCDLFARWPELFSPGTHTLQVEDGRGTRPYLLSNQIQLKVVFDRNSVAPLLRLLKDTKATAETRTFAAQLLGKLASQLPISSFDSSMPAPKQDELVRKFENWWEKEKASPAIDRRIDVINGKVLAR